MGILPAMQVPWHSMHPTLAQQWLLAAGSHRQLRLCVLGLVEAEKSGSVAAGAVKQALKHKQVLKALCLALRLRQPDLVLEAMLATPVSQVCCLVASCAVGCWRLPLFRGVLCLNSPLEKSHCQDRIGLSV